MLWWESIKVDQSQRFSLSQIFKRLEVEFNPEQNLRLDFLEWDFAEVITTKRRFYLAQAALLGVFGSRKDWIHTIVDNIPNIVILHLTQKKSTFQYY